jgi:hypothetical protein
MMMHPKKMIKRDEASSRRLFVWGPSSHLAGRARPPQRRFMPLENTHYRTRHLRSSSWLELDCTFVKM